MKDFFSRDIQIGDMIIYVGKSWGNVPAIKLGQVLAEKNGQLTVKPLEEMVYTHRSNISGKKAVTLKDAERTFVVNDLIKTEIKKIMET